MRADEVRDLIVGAARPVEIEPPPRRTVPLLLALPLATGAALVVHIITDRSLRLAVIGALVVGATALTVGYRRLDTGARRDLAKRVRRGLVAAFFALAAYDASRAVLVALTGFDVKPFGALKLFGRGIVGDDASDGAVWAAGIAYHVINGIGFAISYVLVIKRPRVLTGIAWALCLEAFQATLYPSWFRIEALKEFMTMSLFGHIVYGGTLGYVAARLVTTRTGGSNRSIELTAAARTD